ncbi:MAG: hypothetical protein V1752_07510 [Candidatus Firestonebacteria bacterium]
MRTLIYAPVIHTSADLGSLAEEVTKRGVADLGKDVWDKHMASVEKFWDVILEYFESMDVSGVKIYQDGMVAEGEVGQRIVEEGVKSGSRNYELVARLLKRGAVLVKTEDFNLIKEERNRLLALTQTKSITHKLIAFIKYKLAKDRLLNKRDEFIAQRINETLNEGRTGIIFIGAYHNINLRLCRDIQIKEIKSVQKVRDYQRLLPFWRKNKKQFEDLEKYIVSKMEM